MTEIYFYSVPGISADIPLGYCAVLGAGRNSTDASRLSSALLFIIDQCFYNG